jgi:glycosyltransferase involved in cell wall biosynthesis
MEWIYLACIPRVRALLRALKPDLILATYIRSNGIVASFAKCAPLVLSTRGVDQTFPFWMMGNAMTRQVCRRAEWIHASSQELVGSLVAIGVPERKTTVIPLGIDPDVFRPSLGSRRPGPPRIVCTRKHHPIYSNITIVRALAVLRDTGFDFHCRFVGTGTVIEDAKKEARQRHLERQIEFCGEVPSERLPEYLNDADIYVSASLADGTSSCLLEAMSCRLLPVVSDIAANRPWIQHQVNGFLFPVGDAAGCAEGLRWAWDHREEMSPATAANRESVIQRGNFAVNTAKLERLLVAVAAGRTPDV